MWTFLAAAGTVLLILTTLHVGAQKDSGSQKSEAEQLVDAFNKVFGAHPGIRANHSKGVVLDGAFTPSAAAASLSKAAHLRSEKLQFQLLCVSPQAQECRPFLTQTSCHAAWQ